MALVKIGNRREAPENRRRRIPLSEGVEVVNRGQDRVLVAAVELAGLGRRAYLVVPYGEEDDVAVQGDGIELGIIPLVVWAANAAGRGVKKLIEQRHPDGPAVLTPAATRADGTVEAPAPPPGYVWTLIPAVNAATAPATTGALPIDFGGFFGKMRGIKLFPKAAAAAEQRRAVQEADARGKAGGATVLLPPAPPGMVWALKPAEAPAVTVPAASAPSGTRVPEATLLRQGPEGAVVSGFWDRTEGVDPNLYTTEGARYNLRTRRSGPDRDFRAEGRKR